MFLGSHTHEHIHIGTQARFTLKATSTEAKRTICGDLLIGLGCGLVKNPAHAPGTGPSDLHVCELSPIIRRALKED